MVSQARKAKKPPVPAQKTPAMIECGKSYSLKEFRRRTGFSFEVVRDMRASGLRVVQIGNEHWVRGDDYHAFLAQQPTVDEKKSHNAAPVGNQAERTSPGVDGSA